MLEDAFVRGKAALPADLAAGVCIVRIGKGSYDVDHRQLVRLDHDLREQLILPVSAALRRLAWTVAVQQASALKGFSRLLPIGRFIRVRSRG
jgi:hypothetical protein